MEDEAKRMKCDEDDSARKAAADSDPGQIVPIYRPNMPHFDFQALKKAWTGALGIDRQFIPAEFSGVTVSNERMFASSTDGGVAWTVFDLCSDEPTRPRALTPVIPKDERAINWFTVPGTSFLWAETTPEDTTTPPSRHAAHAYLTADDPVIDVLLPPPWKEMYVTRAHVISVAQVSGDSPVLLVAPFPETEGVIDLGYAKQLTIPSKSMTSMCVDSCVYTARTGATHADSKIFIMTGQIIMYYSGTGVVSGIQTSPIYIELPLMLGLLPPFRLTDAQVSESDLIQKNIRKYIECMLYMSVMTLAVGKTDVAADQDTDLLHDPFIRPEFNGVDDNTKTEVRKLTPALMNTLFRTTLLATCEGLAVTAGHGMYVRCFRNEASWHHIDVPVVCAASDSTSGTIAFVYYTEKKQDDAMDTEGEPAAGTFAGLFDKKTNCKTPRRYWVEIRHHYWQTVTKFKLGKVQPIDITLVAGSMCLLVRFETGVWKITPGVCAPAMDCSDE